MHDYYKSVVNEMVVNACDVPVYEVVVELQHSQFRVLVYEEPDVMRQVVCQACLAGRHFVGVVGDDVELAEPFVIDQQRRPYFGGICHIAMAIDVGHRLPIRRVAEQLHGVGDDGLVGIGVARPPSREHGFGEYSMIW